MSWRRTGTGTTALNPLRENLVFFEPSVIDALGGGFYDTPGG